MSNFDTIYTEPRRAIIAPRAVFVLNPIDLKPGDYMIHTSGIFEVADDPYYWPRFSGEDDRVDIVVRRMGDKDNVWSAINMPAWVRVTISRCRAITCSTGSTESSHTGICPDG